MFQTLAWAIIVLQLAAGVLYNWGIELSPVLCICPEATKIAANIIMEAVRTLIRKGVNYLNIFLMTHK